MKHVLVTGADRGLGYELAARLLERGDTVFAGKYRTQWDLLEKLKEKYPGRLHIIKLDVSSDSSVREAAEAVKAKTQALDILINNAAMGGSDFGNDIFSDQLDFDYMLREYNINALGALRVTHAMIGLVVKGVDRLIVNISSEAGSIGTCWREAGYGYCMSKAAMNMQAAILFNTLRRHHSGLVVNFHPGFMQSVIGAKDFGPDTPHVDFPEGARFFTTPQNTAEHIIAQIAEAQNRFMGDEPAFITYGGDKIEW